MTLISFYKPSQNFENFQRFSLGSIRRKSLFNVQRLT